MQLEGTPSDQLPEVLGTGETSARYLFVSFSGREPDGRDAEYIEWHSLDHRPEQHRLPELRQALRLVSTQACRNARAASSPPYDQVDHVMSYLFTGAEGLPAFNTLGAALNEAGRMPLRLPSIKYMTANLAGKIAAPRAVAGADVIPWRPARGVYMIVEEGRSSPASLASIPGVAGVWWYESDGPESSGRDAAGLQITYCYLDEEPVEVAAAMKHAMQARWEAGPVRGLLAAPFYSVVPFEWDKYLPA